MASAIQNLKMAAHKCPNSKNLPTNTGQQAGPEAQGHHWVTGPHSTNDLTNESRDNGTQVERVEDTLRNR